MQSSISKEQQRGTHVCVRVHVRESSGVLRDGGYGGCSSTGVEENGRRGRAAHREPVGVQKEARGRLAGSEPSRSASEPRKKKTRRGGDALIPDSDSWLRTT